MNMRGGDVNIIMGGNWQEGESPSGKEEMMFLQ